MVLKNDIRLLTCNNLYMHRHQELQFPLWYAAHLGTESEHQVLNGSHTFVSFTQTLLLFGTKFQCSHQMRQDEEGKKSDKAAIRDLVLTFCPTMSIIQKRKLKVLMPVLLVFFTTRGITVESTCEGTLWCLLKIACI